MTRLPRATAAALILATLALPAAAQRMPQPGPGLDQRRICQTRFVMVNSSEAQGDLVARWSANTRAMFGAAWANPDLAADATVRTVPSWPQAIVYLSARPCRLGRGP